MNIGEIDAMTLYYVTVNSLINYLHSALVQCQMESHTRLIHSTNI